MPPDDLKKQLTSLPNSPGVYLFKDESGEIIYIGKAINLKNRVRSYWNTNSWNERPKLAVLMPKVNKIETILTNSEKEALLLEANLVRKHMPRYNVALKDDKRYPWLAITYDESFPRLIIIREPAQFRKTNQKARIFGPYVEAGAMWETIKVLRKVFPMRQRRTPLFKDRSCMNYHIGLCLGPCQNLVKEDFYDNMVHQVEMFLAGRQNEVVLQLKSEMEEAAERLEFEQAAKVRNRLTSLEKVIEKQQVFFQDKNISQDIVAEAHTDRTICICMMKIREGKLISSESVLLPLQDRTTNIEAFQSFIDQYYTNYEDIALPKELILQHKLEDKEALLNVLSTRAKHNVKINIPQRGTKHHLLLLTEKNAKTSLTSQLQQEAAEDQQILSLLVKLQEELSLTKLPRRIECFDISNIQGSDNVASMVVFENAKPKKSDYRTFRIQSVEGQANDFASMKEVVGRRYHRLVSENKPMPNLIIIDGGKGQLNAALEALSKLAPQELDLNSDLNPDLNIIGLAKKQEEIYFPSQSNPIILPRRSDTLHLLQQVRDEAHRFAVTYHRKRRAKRSLLSNFDDLPGIGPARRKSLIKHFGSFDQLQKASLEDIMSVPGLARSIAERIYAAMHNVST